MTRVYERPEPATPGAARTRALVIGAGRYRYAARHREFEEVRDLKSVGPSVREFATKLIRDWGDHLNAPLASVDLLLSEAGSDTPSLWSPIGKQGEVAANTEIDDPTLNNVDIALSRALDRAKPQDHFLFLCCGHGFWKAKAYFMLSDTGKNTNNRFRGLVDLVGFSDGLGVKEPRCQWLFFDCCKDILASSLEPLGNIGDPLINASAGELQRAKEQYGEVCKVPLSSAAIGAQALGMPGGRSRFTDMLINALDGAGATRTLRGEWWVDNFGIQDAMSTYADRIPDLPDPDFYRFNPSSDGGACTKRIQLRRVASAPMSRLVVYSTPAAALKQAHVTVKEASNGASNPLFTQLPPGPRAKLFLDIPPRKGYNVLAVHEGKQYSIEVYADLPMADPTAEFGL